VPVAQMHEGDNSLEFKAKNGVCYYTVAFTQYVVGQRMEARAGTGLTIDRNYYKLEAQRMEDGTLRLTTSKQPLTTFQSGDILQCQIHIHSDKGREYLLVEDPTPSGFVVTERDVPDEGEKWLSWWSRTVIRDDRVAFFARFVPAGDSQLTYALRAENPGTAHSLPTTAYNMYDPSDSASAGELEVEVRP